MIKKGRILKTLSFFERLYDKSKGPDESIFYSKMAVLELCGWIEESLDDLVRRCMERKIIDPLEKKKIDEQFIQKIYGFKYERHFRPLLARIVGEINYVKLEKKVNPKDLQEMKSILKSLAKTRDIEAHTHISGTLKVLDAPSLTKENFKKLFGTLKQFENGLRRMNL